MRGNMNEQCPDCIERRKRSEGDDAAGLVFAACAFLLLIGLHLYAAYVHRAAGKPTTQKFAADSSMAGNLSDGERLRRANKL